MTETQKLYEIEDVELAFGRGGAWLAASRSEDWPAQAAHGVRLAGVFVASIGVSGHVMVLHEFPDLETYGRARLEGPWRPARDAHAISSRTRLLVPAAGWPLRPIAAEGIFTLRTFDVEPGAVERFHELTSQTIWPVGLRADQGDFCGLFTTAVGNRGQIVMLSRYDDLAHWERTRPDATAGTTDEEIDAFQKARAERDQRTFGSQMTVFRRLGVE